MSPQVLTTGLKLEEEDKIRSTSINNRVNNTSWEENPRTQLIDFIFFIDENKLKDETRLKLIVYLLFAPFISFAEAASLLRVTRPRILDIVNTTHILKKKLIEIPGWQRGGREARIRLKEEGHRHRDFILALAERILDEDELTDLIRKAMSRKKLIKTEKTDQGEYLEKTLEIIRRKMQRGEDYTNIASNRAKKAGTPFKELIKLAREAPSPVSVVGGE